MQKSDFFSKKGIGPEFKIYSIVRATSSLKVPYSAFPQKSQLKSPPLFWPTRAGRTANRSEPCDGGNKAFLEPLGGAEAE